MSDILSEIMRQRHQSPFYFCLSCGLQMETLEAVIELYVSEAGFRLNRLLRCISPQLLVSNAFAELLNEVAL